MLFALFENYKLIETLRLWTLKEKYAWRLFTENLTVFGVKTHT